VIATGSYDNGQRQVPTVQVDVIPVTKENMRETVVQDGFHPAEAIYKGAPAAQ
jgi:D-xylose transport system substrate-binding protein